MPEGTTESASYTCRNCGESFPRYYAISLMTSKGGFILHDDSLIWHFLKFTECNRANAERVKQDRIERNNEEYHRMMDML